jgi:hypothetical protein
LAWKPAWSAPMAIFGLGEESGMHNLMRDSIGVGWGFQM